MGLHALDNVFLTNNQISYQSGWSRLIFGRGNSRSSWPIRRAHIKGIGRSSVRF